MGIKFSELPTIEPDLVTDADYIAVLDTSEGILKKTNFEIPLPITKGGTGNTQGYVRAGILEGTAPGPNATAEGIAATSTGAASHAEGVATAALNDGAHAEGTNTIASGSSSHAEGENTKATGTNSHAGGYKTIANFDTETVVGMYNDYNTIADDPVLFAVGNGTSDDNRKNAFVVKQSGNVEIKNKLIAEYGIYWGSTQLVPVIANASGSPVETLTSLKVGHLLYSIPSGGGGGGMPSDPLGIDHGGTGNSVGYIRTGQISGYTSGLRSTAEGEDTDARGENSHAEGYMTNALGNKSHAEGDRTTANHNAHAEGQLTSATGSASHAEGESTTAENQYSHAEGLGSKATGVGAHAEGYSTIANGSYSHAEGDWSKTEGGDDAMGAHAEGGSTLAKGLYSHAEGFSCIAQGKSSHAQGYRTNALGDYSFTGGYDTQADSSAAYSFVFGKGKSVNEKLTNTIPGSAIFGDLNTSKFADSTACPGAAFGVRFSNVSFAAGGSYVATYGITGTASPPVSQPIYLTNLAYGGIYILTCSVYASNSSSNRGSNIGDGTFMVYCRLNSGSETVGKVVPMTGTISPGYTLGAPALSGDTLVIDYTSAFTTLPMQINLVRLA